MASTHRERVYIGTDDEGKDTVKWASGATKRELHDNIVRLYMKYGLIEKYLSEFNISISGGADTRPPVTFEQFSREWAIAMENRPKPPKPTTLAGYKSYLRKNLVPEFGDMLMWEITPFDIQSFFHQHSDLKVKTLREHLLVLKQIFDYALDDERIQLQRNPARSKMVQINYVDGDSEIREALPTEVILEIIDAIQVLPAKLRRLIALLLLTGMRRGEVLGLRWEDIDFDRRVISVRQNVTYVSNDPIIGSPKTKNGTREIPIDPHLNDFLAPIEEHGYVIGDGQEPITLQAYRWMFKCIKDQVDLHDATAHIFRHSYLTMLDEAEVDPKTLQIIAGHGNFGFTMNRYVHGRHNKMLEAGEKFSSLIAKTRQNVAKEAQPSV